MQFDINLILVPLTLLFLVVWLLDKFALRQHRAVKAAAREHKIASENLARSQDTLRLTLERHQLPSDVDALAIEPSTPPEVVAAARDYGIAKQAAAQAQSQLHSTKQSRVVRWAYEYLPILLVIVVVRAWVIEPFNIPSSSMAPTLYTGDFIVVNKSAYGLRLPITHTKILNTGEPEHGDVVVFRYPLQPNQYYIKRMIGLPGDAISYDDGVLSVNGQAVPTTATTYQMPQPLLDTLMPQVIGGQALSDAERADFGRAEESHARYYTETLGEHEYRVRYVGDLNVAKDAPFLLEQSPQVAQDGTKWQITVPEGQYFVMGDNRDRSEDARFWGFVPESHLAGKATYIWMHKPAGFAMPSFSRNGGID
ncbi:signal peptidase I [Moraxella caviae]|uniref:Signal peptidase I n=1 Tax=Moraxella caviae TaxID=34060 RepID=A0A1S9ZXY0_9GAMM|nr:signal peptidase I [Moraxella caviae]OOR88362.1 signal peptidase I [Moraxella caviae]STZ10611.1 Signal peptidase I [Moraxella caviae]